MSKNITLIDADSLCYTGKSTDSLQDIIQKVDDKIQAILDITKADFYQLFISKGKYFRHDLTIKDTDAYYKGHRTYVSQPYKQVIKAYLEADWGAISLKGIEADDCLSYWARQPIWYGKVTNPHSDSVWMLSTDIKYLKDKEQCNIIIASPDKDVYKSIPGRNLNYSQKIDKNTWDMVWVDITEEDAIYFKLRQLIIGDNGDNIKTPFPDSAGDWFVKNKMNFNNVVSAYILGFTYETPTGRGKFVKGYGTSKGLYELSKNYRLLHLLETDEEFTQEVGYIPSLPEFREVEREIIEDTESNPLF